MMKKDILNYLKWTLFPFLYTRIKVAELRFFVRKCQLEQNILYSQVSGICEQKYCDHNIIVSLTTYGKRLQSVHLTIESIMEQTMKPNKIVLWLGDELKGKKLPQSLIILRERGLEIKFCKDIGPHTKLIPSLKEFPNDSIITIDDDLIYNMTMLEGLINAHVETPNYIVANRIHYIRKCKSGKMEPYDKWSQDTSFQEAHPNNFPTGVGGVLYPPNCLDEEVFNEEVFRSKCRYADDVWFKAMALKKGTLSRKVNNDADENTYLLNQTVQDVGLNLLNVRESRNDEQIKAVFDYYNLNDMIK